MDFDYHYLTPPFPDDFLAWYPYDKPEAHSSGSGQQWLQGIRRVTHNELPGLNHTFVVARCRETGDFAGVVWLCESETTPELAHFGWFVAVKAYRGQGTGRGILDGSIDYLESHGVEMIMLPTQTTTVHARAMYARRGFDDFMIEEDGVGCWMVRAARGFYTDYFTRRGNVDVGPLQPSDYIAFDYLVNRIAVRSRLYPLGLVGAKRIVSFKAMPLAADAFACRENGRLLGVAVVDNGEFDFFAHDVTVAPPLVEHVLRAAQGKLTCHIATTDVWKRRVVEQAGLKASGQAQADTPSGQRIDFEVFASA